MYLIKDMLYFYYSPANNPRQLWVQQDSFLYEFKSEVYPIIPIGDGKVLAVVRGDAIYEIDSTGTVKEVFKDVKEVVGYNHIRNILSVAANNGKSYFLDTNTGKITDITMVRNAFHEVPLGVNITTGTILSSEGFNDGIIRGDKWSVDTGRDFWENRWFPPYVFLIGEYGINALNVDTGEYYPILEENGIFSFMYNDFVHYEDGTVAVLSLTTDNNPTVRVYSNIPYGSMITPDHYILYHEGNGRYKYYHLRDRSVSGEIQLPSEARTITVVEDTSNIKELLGGGVLASLIARYS